MSLIFTRWVVVSFNVNVHWSQSQFCLLWTFEWTFFSSPNSNIYFQLFFSFSYSHIILTNVRLSHGLTYIHWRHKIKRKKYITEFPLTLPFSSIPTIVNQIIMNLITWVSIVSFSMFFLIVSNCIELKVS